MKITEVGQFNDGTFPECGTLMRYVFDESLSVEDGDVVGIIGNVATVARDGVVIAQTRVRAVARWNTTGRKQTSKEAR